MSIPSNLGSIQGLLTALKPTSVRLLFASRRPHAAVSPADPREAPAAQRILRRNDAVDGGVLVHLSQAARQASNHQGSTTERTDQSRATLEVTYPTTDPEQATRLSTTGSSSSIPFTEEAPSAPQRSLPEADATHTPWEEDREAVRELERRDREVRQHEAAHKHALGQYATGAASFTFTTGPDGRRYAVAGEVSVDLSEVPGDPKATIRKMTTIRRAALTPQEASPADRAVAAEATRILAHARQEAQAERSAEARAADEPTDESSASSITTATDRRFRIGQRPLLEAHRGRLIDIEA